MIKVTEERLMKFFSNYDDAYTDIGYSLITVEIEIQPEHTLYKTLITNEEAICNLGKSFKVLSSSDFLATGVFKLRTITRDRFDKDTEQCYVLESVQEL